MENNTQFCEKVLKEARRRAVLRELHMLELAGVGPLLIEIYRKEYSDWLGEEPLTDNQKLEDDNGFRVLY